MAQIAIQILNVVRSMVWNAEGRTNRSGLLCEI